MLDKLASPKHTAATRRDSVYPYYAGFSDEFVESVLKTIGNEGAILDPWNGSGTTTAVCARLGIPSYGVDINPAMKPIAATRSASPPDVKRACATAKAVIGSIEPDLVRDASVFELCSILLDRSKTSADTELHDILRFGFMTSCRRLSKQSRSKNPTWFATDRLEALKLPLDEILRICDASFTALAAWKAKDSEPSIFCPPNLVTADWTSTEWNQNVSHVITSPPYLTRIDYVMKTLPELLLLREETGIDLDALRKNMLGSVLTGPVPTPELPLKSLTARTAIEKIRRHPSKASSTYYFRFFHSYFRNLEKSIFKIATSFKNLNTATIVTQGSYYKEIFIDVPNIIDELFDSCGYSCRHRSSFRAKHNIITVNKRSIASNLPPVLEVSSTYERRSK
ncbi:DNA methyltransferase [Aminobacter sp. HY435]|uniref:DNA methyltransferase n=1 Tax=Aminobacter sp. HY435 TaxID=2970917 RepID=UPI0022B9B2B8|nr:DNA methyltransferase [Aminobacter sp. HY435]